MIVVDASAAVEVLLATPKGLQLADRLLAPGQSLIAPELLDIEVTQVLRRLEMGIALSPARGRQALDDLADLPLTRYPHLPLLPRVWQLRKNLTAYDALYVALAEAANSVLLTCDQRLAGSPHRARVEVV